MFTKLSNEATKNLENISIRIENVIPFQERKKLHWSILNWYERHSVKVDEFKKGEKVLTKLLGQTPNYHSQFETKTIVWGFEWLPEGSNREDYPNNTCIIYYAKELGFTIQVHKDFNKASLLPLLKLIYQKLL
jgi:hypothetical protein